MSDYKEAYEEWMTAYKLYDKFPKLDRRITWAIFKALIKLAYITIKFIVVTFFRSLYLKSMHATPTQINSTIDAVATVYMQKYDAIDRNLLLEEMELEDKYL